MPTHAPQIAAYLREVLGVVVTPTLWEGRTGVPAFLSDRYMFLHATLLGHPILFMVDQSPEEETPAVIRKHAAQVRPKTDLPVVYVRSGVTAYNRKRLIEQRVPFLVPGNQLYLPDLGVDLREHFRANAKDRPQVRPATQAVLIHILLHAPQEAVATSDLRPLGYSSMTLNRAFDELQAAGLADVPPASRERLLHLRGNRRELWGRALPLLKTPVRSSHFIQRASREHIGPSAGLTALARYSMIAEPPGPVFAASREHWASLRQRGEVTQLPGRDPAAWEVQVWTYQPPVYKETGVVDPLSLYLSLRGTSDERIEEALDRMMEGLPW